MERTPSKHIRYGIYGLLVIVLLRGAYGVYVASVEKNRVHDMLNKVADKPPVIEVQISGAVVRPGVYTLASEARLHDLVAAAGGFKPGAETGKLNLAEIVGDGQKVVIQPEYARDKVAKELADGETVNINTAPALELQRIPGVGPTLSARIVDMRNTRGLYKSIDEIKLVAGIGDSKYENMKRYISIK